jgi:two-component system chemotaxis response regulator CheV
MAGFLDGVDQRTKLAGHNRLELLLFRLIGRQRFGINVFKVQEVLCCPVLTRIPGSHQVVKGVASARGKTIAVIDLSLAIGGPSLGNGTGNFVIVSEYNRRIQGFLVGAVEHIVNRNWEAILPPPKAAAGNSYLTAVTLVGDQLVQIIDVEKILQEVIGGSEQISAGVLEHRLQGEVQRVLVVDDSSVARNQVTGVLEQLGVEPILCNDGKQALELLKSWVAEGKAVDDYLSLIISDVEMPRMDGYTLTSEIRNDPALVNLHVILHTSLSGVFNEAMVGKVGANQFLAKYQPDELATMIQKQLKTRLRGRKTAA